ncbi:MAG: S8 family serine peptidase [Melioribacteraceae bacterium]|nr:S8 family serine peptidase [Melioribacteraceae bacterium]
MRKISIFLAFAFILCVQVSAANSKNFVQQKEEVKTVPGKFVVKFKAAEGNRTQVSFSKLSMVAAKYNVTSNRQVFTKAKNNKLKEMLNLHNIFVFETDKNSNIQAIVDELNRDPSIEYAEPVYLSKFESVPDDPLYSSLYHLPQIKAPEAWDIQSNSSDVIIGIIDSGVDWDHEDLADNIWINTAEIPDNGIDDDGNGYIDDVRGWDFVTGVSGSEDFNADPNEDGETPDNDPMDFNGHGTHVAGIAGATTNNGIGIASASYGATIMALRCGYQSRDGNGYVPSIFAAEAYIYAADNGAVITNQSSGNSGKAILDAAYYAFLNGVLIVESAGNGDAVTPSGLGAQPWVISVASVNQDDVKTYYSSYGEYVNVSAPGGELFVGNDTWGILSTIVHPSNFYGGQLYTKFQGTSMSAPLVASAAALVKANEPSISVVDLFSRIVGTADNIDGLNPDYTGLLGSGRINLHRALTETVSAEPLFKIVKSEILDPLGNNNGFLDAGEEVELKITFRNVWQNANNVSVSLLTESPWPVVINNGTSNLGNVTGVLDTVSWEATATFTISAAEDAIPISGQFLLNITSDGFAQTIDYTIAVSPQVLFVADFDESGNRFFDFSKYYTDAFEATGVSYDYVHRLDTEVTPELLNMYSTVVWACEWSFPSVDSSDRVALEAFLDGGGSLFLSGQDVAWDLNENSANMDRDFLNNYLKVNYLADDAGRTEIFGVYDNPITDGMELEFYQKKRDSDQQFPDVLEPRDGAISILNYDDERSGAISYSGDYDLVFFGFGGFESIDAEEDRIEIMKNTLDWLSGIDYSVDKLTDTEVSTESYTVNFEAESRSSSISNVYLYWYNYSPPYNRISMTDNGGGKYSAEIPAQNLDTDVSYFVYAEADDGNYVLTSVNEFYVGTDEEPPVVTLVNKPLGNSINVYGPAPYPLTLSMYDNIGIDNKTAKIYYTVNDTEPYNSNPLEYVLEQDLFAGSFSFAEPLNVGDKVSYYFAVKDSSSNANETTTEVYEYYIDTLQVLDGFEDGLSEWALDQGWGLSNRRKSGENSLSDSPIGRYENNLDIIAAYKMPFNLAPYKHAKMEFYLRANLERNKDSLFVEVSNDNGTSWIKEFNIAKSISGFRLQTIDLTNYTGAGNENIMVRYRLLTDSSGQRDGVWIDDVSIVVSYTVVGVEDEIQSMPMEYKLSQNYPNPFNPSTVINYSLPTESRVKLQIFNTLGEVIATLVDETNNAGVHKLEWDASNLASGVYLYRISAESINGSNNFNSVKKMLLIK